MQSLLFPEFSPSDLENQALNRWTQRLLDRFPALDLAGGEVADGAQRFSAWFSRSLGLNSGKRRLCMAVLGA
ncbi:MAG: hypothetical protein AAGG01_22535, partial [Planctomycetota bacterium]